MNKIIDESHNFGYLFCFYMILSYDIVISTYETMTRTLHHTYYCFVLSATVSQVRVKLDKTLNCCSTKLHDLTMFDSVDCSDDYWWDFYLPLSCPYRFVFFKRSLSSDEHCSMFAARCAKTARRRSYRSWLV